MSRRKPAPGYVSITLATETQPPDRVYRLKKGDYRSQGSAAATVLDEMLPGDRHRVQALITETDGWWTLTIPDNLEPGSALAYSIHDFLAGMFSWANDMKEGGEIKGNRLILEWADKRNRFDEKYIKET